MKIKQARNTLLILIVLTLFFNTSLYAKNDDWGLGFPKIGEKPVGNKDAEYLKKYDAYYVGDGDEKIIYLTFDAGYENGYTDCILDTLKKHDIKATFFLVGTYIKNNPDIIKRMVSEGHIIGNHTMSHPDMSKISDLEAFKKELSTTADEYKNVVGTDMLKYYRPPQGKYNENNMQMAKDLGYKTVFWSLAYADWNVDKQPSKDTAFSKLIPRIHPGAILLLHNTSETNCNILDELIQKYTEMGYSFKNLDYLTK